MDNIAVDDINNVMDDPEGGCIVQADDPHMLAVAAFGGPNTGSAISGNNSWYWTSMLKLMDSQGAAPSCSGTHNNYTGAAHFTPGQQAIGQMPTSMSASTSSPSSSSVHDQPINDMLANSNAINANDPDNSVWGQEFLSGSIGESKTSTNMHHLACSDDGLHELLYPRTVLELLFSDQLKLEQLPSWPDILHQTASGTPGRNFGFPLVPDKILTAPAAHHNMMSDNQHFDIKIPPNNYSHLGSLADDRLSSSTASSALSENTINQWAPPNVAGAQCEHAHARLGAIHGMQQFDHTRVKHEYTEAPSQAYSNNDNINYINNMNDPKLLSHYQQQIHLRLLAEKTAGNVIHDEARINHEITAANFSHNLRQGGLDANNYFQHVNNHVGGATAGVPVFDGHSRVGPAPAASLHYQLGKKSRSLDQGGGRGAARGQQADELAAPKKENEIDTKPNVNMWSTSSQQQQQQQQQQHMNSDSIPSGGTNTSITSSPAKGHQQLSGTEYNFKRSRIEQNPAPPTSSSSSFKSQPARKEKLGERITTLQQLVSPFGKTDTASVLLEAIGYIKFLHDQVQALSSPYFKSPTIQSGDRNHNANEAKPDLRSRGLCLVPMSCTMQVANDNGADYWYGGAFR